MTEKTFFIIKPNAVADGATGKILDRILEEGFRILALKMAMLDRPGAEAFYAAHRGKPFFDKLVRFMISGPVVAAVAEKQNAVEDLRALVGATDPGKAAEGTIRRMFGKTVTLNAIHASDSQENARGEWRHFFPDEQIIEAQYRALPEFYDPN